MTAQELVEKCQLAMEKTNGYMYLTIPIPKTLTPHPEGVRLLGNAGPRGKICTVREDEDVLVAVFNAQAILDFLKRRKLVEEV